MSFKIKETPQYEELEKKFKRKIKIVIPNYKHNDRLNLKDFIDNFINRGNVGTIYKKNQKQQCHRGAFRSLGDIYNLCREYYPEVKVGEVMTTLTELWDAGKMRPDYCYTIRKRIFRPGVGYKAGQFNLGYVTKDSLDENGLKGDEFISLLNK